jgi:hypothetical protein
MHLRTAGEALVEIAGLGWECRTRDDFVTKHPKRESLNSNNLVGFEVLSTIAKVQA